VATCNAFMIASDVIFITTFKKNPPQKIETDNIFEIVKS